MGDTCLEARVWDRLPGCTRLLGPAVLIATLVLLLGARKTAGQPIGAGM